jgi:hypothetical protein
MKPLPPIRAIACVRAEASGSSGRGNGIRSMTTNWHDEPGTSTPCHKLSVPNRHVVAVSRELPHKSSDLVLALTKDLDPDPARREAFPQLLGGRLGCPHRREEPEGPPAGSPHQRLQLVHRLGRRAVAPGGRQDEPRHRRWLGAGSRTATRRPSRSRSERPPRANPSSRRPRRRNRPAPRSPRSLSPSGRPTPCRVPTWRHSSVPPAAPPRAWARARARRRPTRAPPRSGQRCRTPRPRRPGQPAGHRPARLRSQV